MKESQDSSRKKLRLLQTDPMSSFRGAGKDRYTSEMLQRDRNKECREEASSGKKAGLALAGNDGLLAAHQTARPKTAQNTVFSFLRQCVIVCVLGGV